MIDLTITPPLRRETVRSYVYRMLYDNIMSLHLTPGTAMSEQEVADLLKTSRTPVREAIIHLGQDRLLDILPQRGTFVSRLHTQMIREARFMRIVLEEAVMKEACVHFPQEGLKKLHQILERQQKAAGDGDKQAFFEADNAFHETVFFWLQPASYLADPDAGQPRLFPCPHAQCFSGTEKYSPFCP